MLASASLPSLAALLPTSYWYEEFAPGWLASVPLLVLAQSAPSRSPASDAPLITITLKNAGATPRHVTIVTYEPGDPLNGTEQVTMAPGAEKKLSYREGTKIYLATPAQVNLVMSGQRLDQAKPFLVLKRRDAGKIFRY